jgi:NlpC/P60 family putative phage cell wall peptidase
VNAIIAEAVSWIGTPYRHQASVKGVGCDCIGLVRGVWRAVSGEEVALPAYTPDWAEVGGREDLLEGLAARFEAVDVARPGDVLVFRMRLRSPAKHAAILSEGGIDDPRAKIIHAYWGHAVVQSWLQPIWRRHLVGAFRFPLRAQNHCHDFGARIENDGATAANGL